MAILYAKCRDASEKVTASQAIFKRTGKKSMEGLYVPTEIETGYSGRETGKMKVRRLHLVMGDS